MEIPRYELEFVWAIEDGELDKIQLLVDRHPELRSDRDSGGLPRAVVVAKAPKDETFEFALKLGHNLNVVGVPPFGGTTALQIAIGRNRLDRTKRLLEEGASPNLDRPVIAAMKSAFPPERQIEFLQMLLAFGADLNRLYDLYGDHAKSFSALDFAPNATVQRFLAEKGALPSREIKQQQGR